MMQLALLGPPPSVDADPLANMGGIERVWLDDVLERGWRFDVLDDELTELVRLEATPREQLRWGWESRARGRRRCWDQLTKPGVLHVAYEPRLERELGAPVEKTDHYRALRTHWPVST